MDNELKNSIKYLESKVGRENGFTLPTNYFKELDNSIDAIISEENLPTKASFDVPDNYFDSIENKVLAQIDFKEKSTKVISLRQRVLKIIPYAAAACIFLFIGINSFVLNNVDEISIDSLSENDLEYWLESNNIQTSDIEYVLKDDLLNDNDFSLTTIEDEIIEDYINLNEDTFLLDEEN